MDFSGHSLWVQSTPSEGAGRRDTSLLVRLVLRPHADAHSPRVRWSSFSAEPRTVISWEVQRDAEPDRMEEEQKVDGRRREGRGEGHGSLLGF